MQVPYRYYNKELSFSAAWEGMGMNGKGKAL